MARTNKKLSAAALKKAANRHNWALQWCWNYEKMQGAGWGYAMAPVVDELYDDNDERCRQLERHSQFYNTTPWSSALVFGACVSLEEAYETDMSDSLKIALMGPLAAIGDTVQAVLLNPPLNILGASLAAAGSWASLIFVLLPSLITHIIKWPLFNYGYKKGAEVIADVSGSSVLDKLQAAASILGVTVIGGFVPSMVGIKIGEIKVGTITDEAGNVTTNTINIQKTLDGIFPSIVGVGLVALCYWMIKTKKISPLKTILILAVATFVLGALGILTR